MKKGFVYFFLLYISVSLLGCSEDSDYLLNSPPRVLPSELYIRFVRPDGGNCLDELGITPQIIKTEYYNYPVNDNGEMNVVISKEQNGMNITPSHVVREYLLSKPDSSTGIIAHSEQEEMLMRISWEDFLGNEVFPEAYDDAYIIKLKSAKIFGNKQEHTIRWSFHVNEGRYNFQVNKCEVDGANHPLQDDLYMNYHSKAFKDKLPVWEMRITGFINMVVE